MGVSPGYFAPMFSRPWRVALLVAAFAVAAQCLGWHDVLLWDDIPLLRDTELYVASSRWTDAVSSPLGGGGATFYWRPVATTSFLVESWIHGGSAAGFRLTSALLHAATSVVAFFLLLRLLGGTRAALLAALAFAVHPVNVEAVTWISARFDLLAALFGLGALAAIPDTADAKGRWRLAAALSLCACLSKESAFLLPLVAAAWALARGLRWRAAAAWTGVGLAVALFLRFEALGYLVRARESSVAEAGNALQHVLLVGRAVATSAHVLVAPWGSVGPMHFAPRPIQPGDALGWTGIALALGLLAATVVAWRRRRRTAWLLIALILSFAPASQVMPLDLAGGLHAADRYLYLPSFFAIAIVADLAVAYATARPGAARTLGAAATVVAVALLAWRVAVLPRWNDAVRFWRWATDMAPQCELAHTNLAEAHLAAGQPEEAEREARLRQGDVRAARSALDAGLSQRPFDVQLRVQRGELELDEGRTAEALADFEAAVRAHDAAGAAGAPADGSPLLARALAGSAESFAGTPGGIGRARERAARADATAGPRDAYAWLRIARAYIALKDAPRASAALDRAAAAGADAGVVGGLRDRVRRPAEGN
jgi:tetratricopeptide (TPR) repeat protein